MNDLDAYIQSIKIYPRINKAREVELSKILLGNESEENKEKARTELVLSNLLLVVSRANKFWQFRRNSSIMDLIAEGNIGLLNAANAKFDSSKGSFATYAITSIDRQIRQAMIKDRFVYIPRSHVFYMFQLARLQEKYRDKLTDKIIMKELEINPALLKRLRQAIASQKIISLEDICNEEGQSVWEDVIADDKANSPADAIENQSLKKHLSSYIKQLNEREQKVVSLCFYGSADVTFEQLGKALNISRERARQIYYKILRKLRRSIFANDSEKCLEYEDRSRRCKKEEDDLLQGNRQEASEHMKLFNYYLSKGYTLTLHRG